MTLLWVVTVNVRFTDDLNFTWSWHVATHQQSAESQQKWYFMHHELGSTVYQLAVLFSITDNWAASEPCRTFPHDVGPKRFVEY